MSEKDKRLNESTKMIRSEAEVKKIDKRLSQIDKEIISKIEEYSKKKKDTFCYPLLGNTRITKDLVDDIFSELKDTFKQCDKLDIIIDSGGGNIHAAYNLAMLLRKYSKKELNFIIPRWAKSAATLLVCGGDYIYMTPVAELGPLDPQIEVFSPLEDRLERFSPLDIESTLDLIRGEFKKGNEKLARGLISRLQFPLTLGSFKKSLDIGKQYLIKLLSTKMLSSSSSKKKVEKIADNLTKGYASHEFCVNIDEAKAMGLKVKEIQNDYLDIIWEIHNLSREKKDLLDKKEEEKIKKIIKKLPPELTKKMPNILKK